MVYVTFPFYCLSASSNWFILTVLKTDKELIPQSIPLRYPTSVRSLCPIVSPALYKSRTLLALWCQDGLEGDTKWCAFCLCCFCPLVSPLVWMYEISPDACDLEAPAPSGTELRHEQGSPHKVSLRSLSTSSHTAAKYFFVLVFYTVFTCFLFFLSVGTKKQNKPFSCWGWGIGKGDAHTTEAAMTSGITANICVLVLRNNK